MDHLDPTFLRHPSRVRPREGCHEPGPLLTTGGRPVVQPPTPDPIPVEAQEETEPLDSLVEFPGIG